MRVRHGGHPRGRGCRRILPGCHRLPRYVSESASSPLFTEAVLVVTQRGKFFSERAEYDIRTPGGVQLGSLHEQRSIASGLFGKLAPAKLDLVDPSGAPIMTMQRPPTVGRSKFTVAQADGTAVGEVSQDSSFLAPQFTLTASDGQRGRLQGGRLGSWNWSLLSADDNEIGRVTKEFSGLSDIVTSADWFVVELTPELRGPLRQLAIAATACLDYIRDEKRRK